MPIPEDLGHYLLARICDLGDFPAMLAQEYAFNSAETKPTPLWRGGRKGIVA